MAGSFYPVVSGDDGCIQTGYFYSGAGSGLSFGDLSNQDTNSFIRFVNVTIPQGATIIEAKLVLNARDSQSANTCNVRISANDVDDSVAPTDTAGFNALVLTTAKVDWNALGAWTEDSDYDSPEIKTIIQEIVDRGSWASGNALTILIKNNVSTTDVYRIAHAIDDDAGVNVAELYVVWSETINSDVTIPSMTVEGFTGIYSATSIPLLEAKGYTGIYSAPSIPMIQSEGFTGITAEPSISMPIAIVTGHDDIVHIEASMTIPSMSAKLTQAKQIWGNVSIPSMVAKATERETTLANVSIPMMTVELTSGIHADLEAIAPMATAEGLFSNQAEITIPMMTAEIEGKVGRVVSSAVKVPMMTVEATGKTEHLANGAVSIPMMRVATKLMTGKIVAGAAEIPIMTVALTSYEDIIGDIDVSIPAMIAYLEGTTERAVCTVLRYDDKPDILGSMTAEIPMIEASLTEL